MKGLRSPSSAGSFPSTFSLSLVGIADGMRVDKVGKNSLCFFMRKEKK